MRTCHAWRALCRQQRHYQWRGICTNEPRPFAVNDLVLLRQVKDQAAQPILTKPLRPHGRIESHLGIIQHADIIGKSPRDIVRPKQTRSGTLSDVGYRLHPVSLHDYVERSRRLVTPIYPNDAGLIVGLLDLHPEVFQYEESSPTLEVLEAGTGHGALTLFLSRAIHAANPPRPPETKDGELGGETNLNSWRSQRKAIIHTIDISERFSAHAMTVVQGFRHGVYANNVDFHVGDVSAWLADKLPERGGQAFLSHAILDMPNADTHLSNVADALVTDGTLIVFNPSITQIGDCARRVLDERIPLELEKVVELGVNGGSGGREWDLRFVQPRSRQTTNLDNRGSGQQDHNGSSVGAAPFMDDGTASGVRQPRQSDELTTSEDELDERALDSESTTEDGVVNNSQRTDKVTHARNADAAKRVMVCRPKVGGRIQGGGFLGVWKKRGQTTPS